MKFLLTGANSFTGSCFAHALSTAGHHVVVPLRKPVAKYVEGVRAERLKRLAAVAEIVEGCAFGGDHFLDVARDGGYNLLCHHAARVGNYRSPDFNVAEALAENTANLRSVLATLGAAATKSFPTSIPLDLPNYRRPFGANSLGLSMPPWDGG